MRYESELYHYGVKSMKCGKKYVTELVKTDLNYADVPVLGKAWSERYITKRGAEQRVKNIDKLADDRVHKYY